MQNSSEFQYIAVDTITESATNPRRTFEECKLIELAESIRTNGLIQPITVRPLSTGEFEVVAGARRFRAAQLAELFSLPARIVAIDDTQALEWQLVENSQRVDVHPYEEAQGFERLLDMPGYDVATLVEKSGKSPAHIYARLSLLQLIPAITEAFRAERITASHANLLARLPQKHQEKAFAECWRKDWSDIEPHLLPAKHLSAWIQTNLFLSLAEAPFSKEDITLNPVAGACITCPRRTGFNASLFHDVLGEGDQCLDGPCYQSKVTAHIDRDLAAHPGLVQIEDGWRKPSEKRPGAVQRGFHREIEVNPDAEPPCAAARPALIVYGKRVGTNLTVCTDDRCPVHCPSAVIRRAEILTPQPQRGEEAEEQKAEHQLRQREYDAEQDRRAEERRLNTEREDEEYEAERSRKEELRQQREVTFEQIVANAPVRLTGAQLRVVLRAIVTLDPYTFADDLAKDIKAEGDTRDAEEVLKAAIDATAESKLPAFAIRLALSGHRGIPRNNEHDMLAEADAVFASTPKPQPNPLKVRKPTLLPATKKSAARKKAAA